jgi:hypothetical protein
VLVAIGLYVATFAAYQTSRSLDFHRDLDSSAKMVAALQGSPELVAGEGTVVLVPADVETERYFLDAFGGYLTVVLQHAFQDSRFVGSVEYAGTPSVPGAIRLTCRYQDGVVTLMRLNPSS